MKTCRSLVKHKTTTPSFSRQVSQHNSTHNSNQCNDRQTFLLRSIYSSVQLVLVAFYIPLDMICHFADKCIVHSVVWRKIIILYIEKKTRAWKCISGSQGRRWRAINSADNSYMIMYEESPRWTWCGRVTAVQCLVASDQDARPACWTGLSLATTGERYLNEVAGCQSEDEGGKWCGDLRTGSAEHSTSVCWTDPSATIQRELVVGAANELCRTSTQVCELWVIITQEIREVVGQVSVVDPVSRVTDEWWQLADTCVDVTECYWSIAHHRHFERTTRLHQHNHTLSSTHGQVSDMTQWHDLEIRDVMMMMMMMTCNDLLQSLFQCQLNLSSLRVR